MIACDRSAISIAAPASRLLPMPASPRKITPGWPAFPASACGPDLFEVVEFVLAADQGSARDLAAVPFGDDAVVLDVAFDTLDGFGGQVVEFEKVSDDVGDRSRDRDAARVGEAAHARGEVRAEAVDVVLVGIEIDHAAVHADADPDVEAESLANFVAEQSGSRVISSPVCTARCPSFSWASGWPKTASRPSPFVDPMWPS